jgi:hypothetical protein
MLVEIIALVFITKYIGKLAIQKGLSPTHWKAYTIGCWLTFEFTGMLLGIVLLNSWDLIALACLGWVSGFGGFLLIRSILQKKTDIDSNKDINRIGVDDLKP